jgi:DNA-binding winged helix-turn-helix (wHTH) protein
MARVWPDLTVEESSLRFHIAQLRRTLGDGWEGKRHITNVAGRGYCFVARVDCTASPYIQHLHG